VLDEANSATAMEFSIFMNTSNIFIKSALLSSVLAIAACNSGNEASRNETGAANQPQQPAASETEAALIERAMGIHERVITLDTHNDFSVTNFTEEVNYTMDVRTQVNLPKMRDGGLDVSWLIVFTGQGPLTDEGYANAHAVAMEKFEAIHWLTKEKAPDEIGLALTSDDVRRLNAEAKKIAMIGVENAYPLGTDLNNIKIFADLGARYISLAHNGHSQFADSNTHERIDPETGKSREPKLYNGLSELGKQAIPLINKHGIMLDLSHPSKESNLQTIALSKAPVIASHSSARGLSPTISRNLSDEELLAVKANGGVVQTVAFASYLDPVRNTAYRDALNELQGKIAADLGFEVKGRGELRDMSETERSVYDEKFEQLELLAAPRLEEEVYAIAPPVDVKVFVNHIDYLVDLIGLDHVGISSDFDGGGGIYNWNSAAETHNVTIELVRRGYTEAQIAQLWSGNLLRVLDEVQAIAKQLQAEDL
jgi:membrane dipeptidase